MTRETVIKQVTQLGIGAVTPRFVYRLHERGKCKTYEIGENDNPRTSPEEWCDRRVCEGFWGDEEMCKRVVSLLNGVQHVICEVLIS